MSNVRLAIGVLSTLVFAQSAVALTVDFAFESTVNGGERGAETISNLTVPGITLDARYLDNSDGGSAPPFAYLDGYSGGRPGGFGVCNTLAGDQCTPASDDNLSLATGTGEVAILIFDSLVRITSISFTNGNHFGRTGDIVGDIGYSVDAGNPTAVGSFSLIDDAALIETQDVNNDWRLVASTSLEGNRFSFIAPETITGSANGDTTKIYISAVTFELIPEPSSTLLTGIGLLVAGLAARRRA